MKAFVSVDLEGMPYIVNVEQLSINRKLFNEARKIMNKIRNEDNKEVRQVWMEQLAEKLRCDRCGGRFHLNGNYIICEKCKRKIPLS